jgi:predicted transcriptional regulator
MKVKKIKDCKTVVSSSIPIFLKENLDCLCLIDNRTPSWIMHTALAEYCKHRQRDINDYLKNGGN